MPEGYVKAIHFATCTLNEDILIVGPKNYPISCDVHVNMMMRYIGLLFLLPFHGMYYIND